MPSRKALEVGRWIQTAREDRGWSRSDLKARAGLDPSYLFRIEKRGVVPRRQVLLSLAEALEVDPRERNRWLQEAGYEPQPDDRAAVPPRHAAAPDQELESNQAPDSPEARDHLDASQIYQDRLRAILGQANWLSKSDALTLEERLRPVIAYVVEKWSRARTIPSIPAHGPDHNCTMVEVLFEHLKAELKCLSLTELHLLTEVCWLYDIGLAQPPAEPPDDSTLLQDYHKHSAMQVGADGARLRLSREERLVVANLCLQHRAPGRLAELVLHGTGRELPLDRQKCILSLLSLARVLETRYDRVRDRSLLAIKSPSFPSDLYGELLRNLFIARIYRDWQHYLWAEITYDEDWDQQRIGLAEAVIRADLQRAVNRAKDVLVLYLKSELLWAETRPGPRPADADMAKKLRAACDLLGTSRFPNAGRVFDSLVEDLTRLRGGAGEDRGVVLARVKDELDAVISLCGHHAQLLNLGDSLTAIISDRHLAPEKKLGKIQDETKLFKDRKDRAYRQIAEVAARKFDRPAVFVVFGYSDCVLTALGALRPEVSAASWVFVLECRNKTVYGEEDTLEYSDGFQYAMAIRQLGYSNVRLASDASAAYVFKLEAWDDVPLPRDKRLLLGVDGIDPEGDVHATVGTLPLVLAANACKAEVYVFAEGGKVREKIDWAGPGRRGEWLTEDDRILRLLNEAGIHRAKPRNERVPGNLITGGFVTEEATERPLTLADFQNKYRRRHP